MLFVRLIYIYISNLQIKNEKDLCEFWINIETQIFIHLYWELKSWRMTCRKIIKWMKKSSIFSYKVEFLNASYLSLLNAKLTLFPLNLNRNFHITLCIFNQLLYESYINICVKVDFYIKLKFPMNFIKLRHSIDDSNLIWISYNE